MEEELKLNKKTIKMTPIDSKNHQNDSQMTPIDSKNHQNDSYPIYTCQFCKQKYSKNSNLHRYMKKCAKKMTTKLYQLLIKKNRIIQSY